MDKITTIRVKSAIITDFMGLDFDDFDSIMVEDHFNFGGCELLQSTYIGNPDNEEVEYKWTIKLDLVDEEGCVAGYVETMIAEHFEIDYDTIIWKELDDEEEMLYEMIRKDYRLDRALQSEMDNLIHEIADKHYGHTVEVEEDFAEWDLISEIVWDIYGEDNLMME